MPLFLSGGTRYGYMTITSYLSQKSRSILSNLCKREEAFPLLPCCCAFSRTYMPYLPTSIVINLEKEVKPGQDEQRVRQHYLRRTQNTWMQAVCNLLLKKTPYKRSECLFYSCLPPTLLSNSLNGKQFVFYHYFWSLPPKTG